MATDVTMNSANHSHVCTVCDVHSNIVRIHDTSCTVISTSLELTFETVLTIGTGIVNIYEIYTESFSGCAGDISIDLINIDASGKSDFHSNADVSINMSVYGEAKSDILARVSISIDSDMLVSAYVNGVGDVVLYIDSIGVFGQGSGGSRVGYEILRYSRGS